MIHKSLLIVLAFLFATVTYAQDIETGKKVVKYLADDQLEGRYPGSEGDKKTLDFLDDMFYEDWMGKFSFGFQQPFTILTDIDIKKNTQLIAGKLKAALHKDFQPFVFSAEDSVNANLIYAGATMKNAPFDFGNKWALIYLNNEPDKMPVFRKLVEEVIMAQEKGAAGLLIASRHNPGSNDEFYPFHHSRSLVSLDLPVVQLSRDFLSSMINPSNITLRKLRKKDPEKINKKLVQINVSAQIKFNRNKSQTANVAAWVEGTKSNEWVIVGAHHDHLGYGGKGSGSRTPDVRAIHNGADDNASGVAMVMMLAEYYKDNPPERNMAFVLFGAEEMGLIGSKYFVNHLPFSKSRIKAMVNYDMVGRMKDSSLSISGVNTAGEYKPILKTWDQKPLNLALGEGGFGGSDHASFYSEQIPVLFFNSGLHDDYHTPADDVDKINFKGMKLIADLSVQLLDSLTNPDIELTYQESKKQKTGRHGSKMKVKMGIMPDVAGTTENGLGVDGVNAGGPADKAGIQKGDAIVQIGSKKIKNIYDYMHQLGELEKGDAVKVKVRRKGKVMELTVQF